MSDHTEVLFPIFSDNLANKTFVANGRNPGVGGTQYVTIVLALMLSRRFPDLLLRIINRSDILIPEAPANLKVELASDINEFLEDLDPCIRNYVIIVPATKLKQAKAWLVDLHRCHILAWIHHPFYLDFWLRNRSCAACVHVGSYQYFSNAIFYKSNWHIGNPFILPRIVRDRSLHDMKSKIRVIYLGALIRGKGFSLLAQQWESLKEIIPQLEMHIIGSSLTYGKLPEHPLIPCDMDFAQEILKYVPVEDIRTGKVVFHGNLGEEKFEVMKSSHFAILNPTGASEAFPASPLECMACGLPVIASDDYGMSDSMHFFPELIIRSPKDIPSKVRYLMSDSLRYEELSTRSIAVATWFDSQSNVVLLRWKRLINLVAHGNAFILPNCKPLLPPYGSYLRRIMRQLSVFLRACAKLVIAWL